jgi:predicted cupin superfamily sugar epimerase
MKLRDLSEEYRTAIKDDEGNYIRVYELDPDKYKKEMLEAGKETTRDRGKNEYHEVAPSIRFVADGSTKSVYVFSDEVTHSDAMDALHISIYNTDGSYKQMMMGYASYNDHTREWIFGGFSWMSDKEGRGSYYNQGKSAYNKNEWLFLNKYIPLPQRIASRHEERQA